MLAAACTLIRGRFWHMAAPAEGRLASFEAWDDLVRQTVVWADMALRPSEFGDPMDLVREAQAADPEADALFALLDALRERFGDAEFSAKDVTRACELKGENGLTGFKRGPIETAIIDLAGDPPARSAKSLGRVLRYREGRIVNGLRLQGRRDRNSGARMFRVRSVET